jgi:hypothetical protein
VTQRSHSKLFANLTVQLISCLILMIVVAADAVAGPQEKVNPTGAQVKGFLDRVNDYVDAKKKLEGDLPPVSPSDRTAGVEHHRAALAERIRAGRQGARPGDVFGDAAPLFKELLARDRRTRGQKDTGAALQEVPARSPVVNASYPEQAPLATVPPLVLTNLPPLPDGLEYRFLGRDLILRDRTANLIVDFIPGAVPARR